jgi:LemA protein
MENESSPAKKSGMSWWIWVVVAVAVVGVAGLLVFGWYVRGYNRAVAMEQNVKQAWAQVDVVVTRRFDLIPNLVETVKGYATHEKAVLDNLANARTQYVNAQNVGQKAAAASLFDKALVNVLALAENYPNLKANENFMKLQDSLEGAENRISVERMRYNQAVQALNTYHRSFFGNFFCRKAGVEMAEFYDAPEEKQEVPKVQF